MSTFVPEISMENSFRPFNDIYSTSNQVKSAVPENELMEILWKDGPMHRFMQNEMNVKHPPSTFELKQTKIPNFVCPTIPHNSVQQSENFLQCSLGDSFEEDFCSELLSDVCSGTSKENKEIDANVPVSETGTVCMVSPLNNLRNGKQINFSHFLKPIRTQSSSLTASVPSVCDGNQCIVISREGVKECGKIISPSEKLQNTPFGATMMSSGVSECTLAPKSTRSNNVHKRKERVGEELESYREEAGYESSDPDKISPRPKSIRKARASEVHNLSERRRRDRINEKMKALQELIPHCHKTDKASMLDEAIEYLKSLQLQLQLMWMGSGMAPMMFPISLQQCMSRVGIGTTHASSVPSVNNAAQSFRTPQVSNNMPVSSYNFPTQMQNVQLPAKSYVPYLQFPHIQMPNQGIHTYASQHMLKQTTTLPGNNSMPTTGVSIQNIHDVFHAQVDEVRSHKF